MSELKFNCPTCGQPILVDAREAGRKLVCPSCKSQLTIPKPSWSSVPKPDPRAPAGPVETAPKPPPAPVPTQVSVPLRLTRPTPPPAATTPTSSTPDTAGAPADDASQPVQIAVLTSDLKRHLVQAARKLIADPQRWMPGVSEKGKLLYAAKQVKGRWKAVEPGSGEATHHSLMGAVLHELHRRNVAPTATGRTEFLDGEIPDAIRNVTPEVTKVAAKEELPKAKAARLMSLSHAQCLEVLDFLDRAYGAKAAAEAEAPARSESRGATLDELLVRAARDEVMTVTEVLRALHAELVTLDHRLTELEKTAATAALHLPTARST